jgi:hypothetical protein
MGVRLEYAGPQYIDIAVFATYTVPLPEQTRAVLFLLFLHLSRYSFLSFLPGLRVRILRKSAATLLSPLLVLGI